MYEEAPGCRLGPRVPSSATCFAKKEKRAARNLKGWWFQVDGSAPTYCVSGRAQNQQAVALNLEVALLPIKQGPALD